MQAQTCAFTVITALTNLGKTIKAYRFAPAAVWLLVGASGSAEAGNLVQYGFDGTLENNDSVHIQGFISYDPATPVVPGASSTQGTGGSDTYDSDAGHTMSYNVTIYGNSPSTTITDSSTDTKVGVIRVSFSGPDGGSSGSGFDFVLGDFEFSTFTRATGQLTSAALPDGIPTYPAQSEMNFFYAVLPDHPVYQGYVNLPGNLTFDLGDVYPDPEPSTIIPATTAVLIVLGYARRRAKQAAA